MTRSEARDAWKASGLTNADLTKDNLARLRKLIDTEMRASGIFRDTYRAGRAARLKALDDGKIFANIQCQSDYFDSRQAVTFDADGFVGFAGWADDENVQPVLKGFSRWLEEMTTSVPA